MIVGVRVYEIKDLGYLFNPYDFNDFSMFIVARMFFVVLNIIFVNGGSF